MFLSRLFVAAAVVVSFVTVSPPAQASGGGCQNLLRNCSAAARNEFNRCVSGCQGDGDCRSACVDQFQNAEDQCDEEFNECLGE
jgi:hypothetical protein